LSQEKLDEALKDLDAALEAEPGNIPTLLMRSQVHRVNNDSKAARADIDRALEIQPDLPQAILQRSALSASDERFQDAIDDMKLILSTVDDARLQLQLARLYVLNEQPKLALDVYAELLKEDEDNLAARRGRADALLSIGKQTEALGDYEVALKANPEDDHVLNNLAWVLATSPDKDLRQGKRAVELATKACEITEYKAPHILSTLAAAYAELGDFGTAIEWSSKAVELDSGQIEQLAKELESYKQNKPWRELQEIEEKPSAPPQEPPRENDLQPAEEP
jgi:tetratricopeptide (TPR) repeat protein